MRWKLKLEVTRDGVKANGVILCKTMWQPDMREAWRARPSTDDTGLIYRRDYTKKALEDNYGELGIRLPRGAKLGTIWEAEVETELYGVWKPEGAIGRELDEADGFEDGDAYLGYVIFLDDTTTIEVTRADLAEG